MQSPKAAEVYQASSGPIENYSRPRKTCHTNFITTSETDGFQVYCKSPNRSRPQSRRLTIDLDVPTEIGATESKSLPVLGAFKPSKAKHANWSPLPVAVLDMYQPRSINVTGRYAGDVRVLGAGGSVRKPPDQQRQQYQTPVNLANQKSTKSPRHTPLEPWVSQHRRKGNDEIMDDWSLQQKAKIMDEMETFGVIQRHFDGQIVGPSSSAKMFCRAYSPSPPTIPLPDSPESLSRKQIKEPIDIFSMDPSDLPNRPPPVVPAQNRNHKRTANPSISTATQSAILIDGDFAFAANGNYSPYDEEIEILHGAKKRNSKTTKLGQVARAGSSYLGRLAPPILSHEALTATGQLGLNNLSNLLKQGGPRLEQLKPSTGRKRNTTKKFLVKPKSSLATRVGTVEGSPHRARKQVIKPGSPACTREMTTLGGVKHLKIVIPTEAFSNTATFPFMFSPSNRRRRSRQISFTFNEEMLNPLASPQIERILASVEPYYHRMLSEPGLLKWRTAKKSPKSPKPIPVNEHPLASREDQTRARKLRDLQRMKKRPLSICAQGIKHSRAISSISLKPVPNSESLQSVLEKLQEHNGMDEDDNFGNDTSINRMNQLQSRMISLQKQNTRLTEALAKVMGLSLQEGDLESEEVLRVFAQSLVSMRPVRE